MEQAKEGKSIREYTMDGLTTLVFVCVVVVCASMLVIATVGVVMTVLQHSTFGQFINI